MHSHPPPTDGPNTRYRLQQSLPPISGSTAPYPSPSESPAETQYESFEDKNAGDPSSLNLEGERRAGENQNVVMSYDEWKEWKDITKRRSLNMSTNSQSSQSYDAPPFEPVTYVEVPTSASSQATYYVIDPNLDFDPPSADSSNYYFGSDYLPSTPFAQAEPISPFEPAPHYVPESQPSSSHYERDRLVSTSSIIDHGQSPELDDVFVANAAPVSNAPVATMTKEEWLRMGGFVEASPPRSTTYQFPDAGYPAYSLPPPPPSFPQHQHQHQHQHPYPPLPAPQPQYPPHQPSPTHHHRNVPRSVASSTRSAPSPSSTKHRRAAPYPSSSSSASSRAPEHPSSLPTFSTISFPSLPSSIPPQATPGGSKKSHGRRVSVTHIPRPRNAFILFRSHAVATGLIPKELGIVDYKNISKVIGEVWRGLGNEEKRAWELMAEEEKRVHGIKYPDYKYKPKAKAERSMKMEEESDGEKVRRRDKERRRKKVARGRKAASEATSVSSRGDVEVRRTGRVRTKPANDSYAYDDEDIDVNEELESEDEDEIPVGGEASDPRGEGMSAGMSQWDLYSPTESKPTLPPLSSSIKLEFTPRRVESIAQAILEGEPDETVRARVEADLAAAEQDTDSFHSSMFKVPQSKSKTSTPSRGFPPAPSSSGLTPTSSYPSSKRPSPSHRSKHSSSPAHSSNPVPRDSPASACSSSSSGISPPFKHSRLARRNSAMNWLDRNQPPSTSNPNSPTTPTHDQRMGMFSPSSTSAAGSPRHPLAMSYPPQSSSAQHEPTYAYDPPSLTQQQASAPSSTRNEAYASLGHAQPSPMSPGFPRSPFVHPSSAFDNSPLLGGASNEPGGTRKFSLGRWELRKPSEQRQVSRRELLAEEEETAAPGEGREAGTFDLLPTFLGIEEFGGVGEAEAEGRGWEKPGEGGMLFHRGRSDLFAAPTKVREMMGGTGRGGGGGLRGEEESEVASSWGGESSAFTSSEF